MTNDRLRIRRRAEQLVGDDKRIIARPLQLDRTGRRARTVIRRVSALSEAEVRRELAAIRRRFGRRHRNVDELLDDHWQQATATLRKRVELSRPRQRLVGAYFTMEYSIESAALLNPSIVAHPDQSGVRPGAVRILLSLRAIGEGHLSSIVFRRGTLNARGHITFDPPRPHAVVARPMPDLLYGKEAFGRMVASMGVDGRLAARVLRTLPREFTLAALERALRAVREEGGEDDRFRRTAADLRWIAQANYRLEFPADCAPAEIVIFPATNNERMGMEDLRLVRFVDDDGNAHYYGTYTAYDGRRIMPMLLDTADFRTFHVHTLGGRFARNKGAALFPRKVGGKYLIASRHDGENLFLLESDSLTVWNTSQPLLRPRYRWEILQVGNCGSPLETDAGWILLTHGVGPMREYVISAALLDLDDPSRVLGRLKEPLIRPTEAEREGYVPNVVYSCGSMIHGDDLVIPYAMSDTRSSFAHVSVRTLIDRLLADGA